LRRKVIRLRRADLRGEHQKVEKEREVEMVVEVLDMMKGEKVKKVKRMMAEVQGVKVGARMMRQMRVRVKTRAVYSRNSMMVMGLDLQKRGKRSLLTSLGNL
jgi:hypothetical protein